MIIDVRDTEEIKKEGRVKEALNIPLNELKNNCYAILKLGSKENIQLLCRSGSRAKIAKGLLESEAKETISLEIIEGGLQGLGSGKVIKSNGNISISIMRQVMIIAGLMVFAFSLAGFFFNPLLHWAPTIIGAALFMAGLSGVCPMAIILGKMPWNK